MSDLRYYGDKSHWTRIICSEVAPSSWRPPRIEKQAVAPVASVGRYSLHGGPFLKIIEGDNKRGKRASPSVHRVKKKKEL